MTDSDPMIYLNGETCPKSAAVMSVDERGMLYGDGVYEVLRFFAGQPLAMDRHVERMRKSLSRIELDPPEDFDRFPQIAQSLLEGNGLTDARFYWQITRGASPRNVCYPKDVPPTVLVVPSACAGLDLAAPVPTQTAILVPDERWSNCWVKSLMLLPNVMAANAAFRAGADAAILHRDGKVTEATNANIMIVRAGELWTHPADRWILNGVTRQLVMERADAAGIPLREKPFGTEDLLTADEAFLTGTTINVTAVTQIDGHLINSGRPGPVALGLHEALSLHIHSQCLFTS